MFTVLKSGRESEHGLYKGELGWWWVEQGRWEGGWRNGGQARLLWTDLLLCVYNSSEYRYHYSLSREAGGPTLWP